MNKEDKELLIKDLCARLPYNVAIEYGRNKCMVVENIDTYVDIVNDAFLIESVKPYLFPLSSMTEEQRKEYYEVCRQDWIDNKSKDIGEIEVLNKGVDWLNEHHFDYRGLIDKGLAIDCTNLNIY